MICSSMRAVPRRRTRCRPKRLPFAKSNMFDVNRENAMSG